MQNKSPNPLRYILDTNIVTYHQLGRSAVSNRIRQAAFGEIATTVITQYEQLRGRLAEINRQQTDTQLQIAYQRFQLTHSYFCNIRVLPFDESAAGFYRSLLQTARRIGVQDVRIASIALAHQAILVTANRRDFELIPGLTLEDWSVERYRLSTLLNTGILY